MDQRIEFHPIPSLSVISKPINVYVFIVLWSYELFINTFVQALMSSYF